MLISDAFAQAAGSSTGSSIDPTLMFLVPMVLVFYFLIIRPQQKVAKEKRTMTESLKTGDEVITAGGVLGKIVKVTDQYLTVDIAHEKTQSVEVVVQRSAVQTLLPKGTIKDI